MFQLSRSQLVFKKFRDGHKSLYPAARAWTKVIPLVEEYASVAFMGSFAAV